MTTQLHDSGEEFIIKYVFPDTVSKPANVDVGLYNDSSDSLSDGDGLGNISTEPSSGNYSRQSISFGGSGFSAAQSGGDWQATNDSTVTFDVTNSSQTVDSYFVVVNYNSSDQLFFTGDLSQSRDLSQIDTLDVNVVGASLD